MYNLSANIYGKTLPLMYTLLPAKSELIYLKLYKILDEIPNFKPKEITVDFELAVINALIKVWPALIILLCWFHYSLSFWRNMQTKHLEKDYMQKTRFLENCLNI